jgi:hypothetical protein
MYLECRFPGAEKVSPDNLKILAGTNGVLSKSQNVREVAPLDQAAWTAAEDWMQCNAALQMDHFIHYDGLLLVENGICNTRF